jgi:2-dehydro-3-deoxygluconokinase
VPNTSGDLEAANFRSMIEEVHERYPDLEVISTTLRTVHTATVNDWGALAWSPQAGFVEAEHRHGLEVMDRVGGGDSFASGLLYGLLEIGDLQAAVDYGAAHGALAMTTPGDTSMATLAEVRRLVDGAGARVQR